MSVHVKAAIWRNESKRRPLRHNVTFARLYKDKEGGAWKSTHSFGRDDLLPLAKVVNEAHSRIYALPQEEPEPETEP